MIQHPIETWQDLSWQDELKSLITEPKELFKRLRLPLEMLDKAEAAAKLFQLRVTPSFVNRMTPGDLNDPLLKQVLPIDAEFRSAPLYSDDPLEEAQHNPLPGLIHKYTSRVLVISASNCAINCRYCFRRAFDYKSNQLTQKDWQAIVDYIDARPEIDEIIFSGGEPLLLSDKQFEKILGALSTIKHLKRVRIHSRLPIVLPSRLSKSLLAALSKTKLQTVLVVHCNHANELDDIVGQALLSARDSGLTILNQSVLLRGINDSAAQQIDLAKRLFDFQVLPYYLHMLDRVNGAGHFEVLEQHAFAIYNEMKAHLPGYLLPKLVREEAGKPSKTVISPPS